MSALAPYASPAEQEALLDQLAAAASAEVLTYGESRQGRPLRVARVFGTGGRSRSVLCTAGIHGVEYIASALALELLRALGERSSSAAALLDQADVWIAPCLNPDGRARTFAQVGRGALRELRPNAAGVDLNRNFPPPVGQRYRDLPWAGSSAEGSLNFRGPAALSEPETAALDRLLQQRCFHASINLHSFMGTVIPARVRGREHFEVYRELARRLARAQPRWRYRRLSSRLFDVYTGELEDHQHHNLGCWATCLEVMPLVQSYRQHLRAPTTFWRFNPRDPRPFLDNDLPGVVAWLQAAQQQPRPGPMVHAAL